VCVCVCLFVCLFVCFFPHDMSTTDVAITKLDTVMMDRLHDKSWKLIYFGVKRSKIKVTRHMAILWVMASSVLLLSSSSSFSYYYYYYYYQTSK